MAKDKYKCPNCKKHILVIIFSDCPHCGGGQVYECEECGMRFDIETKEEI